MAGSYSSQQGTKRVFKRKVQSNGPLHLEGTFAFFSRPPPFSNAVQQGTSVAYTSVRQQKLQRERESNEQLRQMKQ